MPSGSTCVRLDVCILCVVCILYIYSFKLFLYFIVMMDLLRERAADLGWQLLEGGASVDSERPASPGPAAQIPAQVRLLGVWEADILPISRTLWKRIAIRFGWRGRFGFNYPPQ